VGTVQVAYPWQPNQPHRGDITKLLVHRRGRGRGIGRTLMEHAETEARADGKTLLVLDAVTDGDAFRRYTRHGWVAVGEVPDFALYPDGRTCPTTFFYKFI
jgi:GNAT superfamily N-acetyltransferase